MNKTTAHHKEGGAKTFERRDPLSGAVASTAPAMNIAQATAAVERAHAAFPAWAATTPAERRTLLNRAADLLEERTPEFERLMLAEVGATKDWVHHNIIMGVNNLREAAAITTQIGGEVIPSNQPGVFAMAIRRPVGVCLGIAPWNGTLSLASRSVAIPLACGNTTIMRASELSPASHLLFGKCLTDAGIPEDACSVITNDPADGADIIQALVSHKAVRRVNFTGSTRVGKIVAGIAAQHLKPTLLELGGKNSLIVLNDADLDASVDAAVFGSFMYQGQVCMTTGRLIVEEGIADAFISQFLTRTSALRVGDPHKNADVVLACLIGEPQAKHAKELVDEAIRHGAKLLTGGGLDGNFMQPTVLDDVTPGMRIFYEEVFGPAVSITRARDVDHALAMANDTEYGLSGSIFTTDVTKALELASRWQSGCVHINGATLAVEAHTPYGGIKDSGYGRFGGKWAIPEFTDVQYVTINNKQHYPF